jgi:hypothetical protein
MIDVATTVDMIHMAGYTVPCLHPKAIFLCAHLDKLTTKIFTSSLVTDDCQFEQTTRPYYHAVSSGSNAREHDVLAILTIIIELIFVQFGFKDELLTLRADRKNLTYEEHQADIVAKLARIKDSEELQDSFVATLCKLAEM